MIATKPVDFRKGAEGLAALVKAQMGADPFSGTIYVFRAKRTDRIKLIFWDGSGVCLVAKRIEDGEFHWPRMQDGVMHLTAAQFSALFEGLDWKRVRQADTHRPRPNKSGSQQKLLAEGCAVSLQTERLLKRPEFPEPSPDLLSIFNFEALPLRFITGLSTILLI